MLEEVCHEENFFITESTKKNKKGLSVFFKEDKSCPSLVQYFFLSLFLHPVVIGILWLLAKLVIICMITLGINLPVFQKPEPKIRDVEFVLINHSKKSLKSVNRKREVKPLPINKPKINPVKSNTKELKNNIKPLESNNSISKVPVKPIKKMTESAAKNNLSRTLNKNQINQAQSIQKIQHNKSLPSTKGDNQAKIDNIGDFSIPSNIKPLKSGTTGVTGIDNDLSPSSLINASGDNAGDEESLGKGQRKVSGFNKNTASNIIKAYDITPYVNDLQRNIKWNWKPVKGQNDKKVELFLKIAKDGKIIILNIKRTSEIAEVDNAATDAVKKASPLNPLPSEYKKGYLDIVFTFDNSISSIRSRY